MFKDLIFKLYKAIKALVTQRILIECDGITYEFRNVPLKKILNWILVETSILLKPAKPWGWPTHFQIEPTNLCNLRCTLCPVTEGMDRLSGHMDFDVFKKFIDEVGDYVFLIILWDWGEPFLNKSIYDMIKYAKKRSIKIVSSTNGHIFSTEDHAEKVVRSGLDSLIFALDGISQNTYEHYRKGGDINKILSGIKRVVATKRKLNSKKPFINLRFIVMEHNEYEIPKLKDFAKSLGVDALTLKTLNPHDEFITEEEARNFMPKSPVFQRFKYDPISHSRIRRKQNPCKALWNNPIIHWDGKVSPCTFDPNDAYTMGDMTKDNFYTIWRGTPYLQLRSQFHEDYKKIKQCSECTYAFKGGTLSKETVLPACFFNEIQLSD